MPSQTIEDALLTARAIGYRYMWVDSLCIVADEFGEVQMQMDNMGQAYMGACLTIAAAASHDAHSGIKWLHPELCTNSRGLELIIGRCFGTALLGYKTVTIRDSLWYHSVSDLSGTRPVQTSACVRGRAG